MDSGRREAHRVACQLKEVEEETAELAVARAVGEGDGMECAMSGGGGASLWKTYKSSDRKERKRRSLSLGEGLNENGIAPLEEVAEEGNDAGTEEGKKMEEGDKVGNGASDDSNAVRAEAKEESVDTFNVRNCIACELLSAKEAELCQRLELLPTQYIDAKKALIKESFTHGILDRGDGDLNRRSIVKIDVEKRDNVIDFILQSGWISSKPRYDELCCL